MAQVRSLSDKEERLLGALAHGSIVSQGPGILVGILLYLTQRDRSQRASFQALQAAVYQLIGLLLTIGLWLLWGIFFAISMIPVLQDPDAYEDSVPPLFIISMVSMVIPFALMMLWLLYGLVGGLQVLRGRDFRYFIIGNVLNKTLNNQAPES